MKKKFIIIGVIILIIITIFFIVPKENYKPFTWDGEECITYTKDCTCYGSLLTMESYPPQYRCQGLNFCSDINTISCN